MSIKRYNRKKILEQLVIDCNRFEFTEEESLSYISTRAGVGIERSHYYAIKKRIKKNELKSCQDRLVIHANSGFLINHFKRMDEAEHLQSILFKTLHTEVSKPVKEQSPFAISKIVSNIMMNSRYLHELNISSPIINQMKEYIQTTISATVTVEKSKISEATNHAEDSSAMGTLSQLEHVFKTANSIKREGPADRVF